MKPRTCLWKVRNLNCDWGQTREIIVRESSELKARRRAGREACGVKISDVMDPRRFSCQEVTAVGDPEILSHSIAE